MIKLARKFHSVGLMAFACAFTFAFLGQTADDSVAQTAKPSTNRAAASGMALIGSGPSQGVADSQEAEVGVQPVWRYTRFGWQDANEWTSLNQIVRPPQRGLDHFHPLMLAMLILFSVLAATLWASNEWEVAQLLGDRGDLENSATD